MELTGSVVDQLTGKALPGVTIWEISPGGQSAEVVGFTDASGKYDVNINNAGSNVNFVTDGYTGTSIPAGQAFLSDQVLLAPAGTATATVSVSNIPAWIWILLAALGIYFVGDGKKKK